MAPAGRGPRLGPGVIAVPGRRMAPVGAAGRILGVPTMPGVCARTGTPGLAISDGREGPATLAGPLVAGVEPAGDCVVSGMVRTGVTGVSIGAASATASTGGGVGTIRVPVGSVGRALPPERLPPTVGRPEPVARLETLRPPLLPEPELVDGVLMLLLLCSADEASRLLGRRCPPSGGGGNSATAGLPNDRQGADSAPVALFRLAAYWNSAARSRSVKAVFRARSRAPFVSPVCQQTALAQR